MYKISFFSGGLKGVASYVGGRFWRLISRNGFGILILNVCYKVMSKVFLLEKSRKFLEISGDFYITFNNSIWKITD